MGYAPSFTADLTGVYQTTPWAYAARDREAEMHKKRLETMDAQNKALEDSLKTQQQMREYRELQMQQMQQAVQRQQRLDDAYDVVGQVLQPVMMDVGNPQFENNLQGAYAAGAEIVGPEGMDEYNTRFFEFLPVARQHRQVWAQSEIRNIDGQIEKLDKAARIDRSTGPGPNSSRRIELDSRRKRLSEILPKAKQKWGRAGPGTLYEEYSGALKPFEESFTLKPNESYSSTTGFQADKGPAPAPDEQFTLSPQDERHITRTLPNGARVTERIAKNWSNRVTGEEPNEIRGPKEVPGVGKVYFSTYTSPNTGERFILWSPTDPDGSVASGEDIYDFDQAYVSERDHHEIMATPAEERLAALNARKWGGVESSSSGREPTGLEPEYRNRVENVLAEADAARAANAEADQPGAPLSSQASAAPPQDNVFNPGLGGPVAQRGGPQTVRELPPPDLGVGTGLNTQDLLGQTPGTVGTSTATIGHPRQIAMNKAAMAIFTGDMDNLSTGHPAFAAARDEDFRLMIENLESEVRDINKSFGNSFGNMRGAFQVGALDGNQVADLVSGLLQQGMREVNIKPDQLESLSSRLATQPFVMTLDNTGAIDVRLLSSVSQTFTGERSLEERHIRANAQAGILQLMVDDHVRQTYGAVRRHWMRVAEKEAEARGLNPRELAEIVGNNKNFIMAHTEEILDKTDLTDVLPDVNTMRDFINEELTINPKSEDEHELMRTIHFSSTMNGAYARNYFDGLKRGEKKYGKMEEWRRDNMLLHHQVYNNLPDVDKDSVGMTSGVMKKEFVKNSLGETEQKERVFRIYTNADGKGGAIMYTPGFRTMMNGIYLTHKEFEALKNKNVEHYPEWFKVNMPGWI